MGVRMPIKPEMRGFYPSDWPQISRRVRFERAAGMGFGVYSNDCINAGCRAPPRTQNLAQCG